MSKYSGSKMKAAQLTQIGKPLIINDIPIPVPAQGELLVKLESSGVCHTDLHYFNGEEHLDPEQLPITMGHEGIGRVCSIGEGTDTKFKPGDRVGVPWIHETCNHCRCCLTGHESICPDQRAQGVHVDGTFAEFVIVKEAYAISIPDSLCSIQAAPLMCAGITAYAAVKKSSLGLSDRCAIIGCGGLGQYAIQFAKLSGAVTIAIDSDDEKLKQAQIYGADYTVNANLQTTDTLKKLGGIDACINFAPSPHIWPHVVENLNHLGRFVSVAMVNESVSLSLAWLTYITPVITGSSVAGRADFRSFFEVVANHKISIEIERFRLNEINTIFKRLKNGQIKGRAVIDLT